MNTTITRAMNFLGKLLDGADIRVVPLASVAEIARGTPITQKSTTSGEYPVIAGGRSPAYYHNLSNRTGETIVIAGSGAYAGFVSWWDRPIFVSDAFSVHPHSGLLSKYCFYWLQGMQQELHDLKSGGGVPHVYPHDVARLQIPIPCPESVEKSLVIQSEIVRILDELISTNSELTRQLTHEISMREKQFNDYRDRLLSFEDREVAWLTLDEVALAFGRGKSKHRPRNDPRLYGGSVPFIQTGDIRSAFHIITEYTQTYSDFGLKQSKLWPKGTLCITIAANIAETGVLGFDACFPDSVIGFVANPEKTSAAYVEYLLSSFKSKLKSKSTGCAQDNINLGTFERLRLPFPPVDQQAGIVAVLDRFHALTSSIGEVLSREIVLRQSRVEYYRDLLLSVPRSAVAS